MAPEGVRIADELFLGAVPGDRGPWITRLVDEFTGEPIAGAEVLLVEESAHPIAGEFWFSHRGVSDADGFVRIPRPNGDRDWHIQVMRHPDHGTVARSGHWNGPWRVGPAYDVPVRITDWLGRPAPGARIGFCGGCGHTPDLVNATADRDGIAVLRGIDPNQSIADLYVQHPGLHFFYESVDWRPGDGPMRVQCSYGPPHTGRVVDHLGAPVANAYVRSGGRHRGPWGRTAADGTFTVLGAEPDETPHQVTTPSGREVHFPAAGRYPVTLRLPDLADADAHQGTIDVPERGDAVAPATRRVRVTVDGIPDPHFEIAAWYPGLPEWDYTNDRDVAIPLAGPFVLHVHTSEDRRREFAFAEARDVVSPLVVRWTPDARIRGRVVDRDGTPLAARVRLRGGDGESWVDCDGSRIDLAPKRPGWHLLEVEHQGGLRRARLVWVRVPEPADAAVVDLGDVRLGLPPSLRVVDAAGAPVADAKVAFARPGWHEPGQPSAWPLDADGGWAGPDLQAGDVVYAQRGDDDVPHRVLLRGGGPWTIVVPTGRLDFEVVDAIGAPLTGAITVGAHMARVEHGTATLRGLAPGSVRCFVGVPGHRSAVVDAVVGTEPKTIRVVLPAR